MFGKTRQTESVLAALRAENTDLRMQLRHERLEAASREKELLDRLMAVLAPGSLRQVVRATAAPTLEPASEEKRPTRIHYPGYPARTRPPSPQNASLPAPDPNDQNDSIPDDSSSPTETETA